MNVLSRLQAYFAQLGRRLLEIRDTPHALAGGVAIGMFFGFTPLFGLKTLLCLAAAAALRCNPIAAVISVCLHDIVTPFWPFILRVEYDIGHFVLSRPHTLPEKISAGSLHPAELLQWTTFLHVGLPLLVGSLFLAVPAAAAAYAIFFTWAARREKSAAGRQHPPPGPNCR
ncbi:MAG: DUF2062 domain-containing protein [Terrimicrobiaceae bacterium]|nr:DUF2062 domain-containing protein [Terrimicrobiaceae bacterium]